LSAPESDSILGMSNMLERQLALLSLLTASRRGLSRTQIGRKLPTFYPGGAGKNVEASRKKLQRDAEALSAMGMPVFCAPDGDGDELFSLAPGSEPLPESFMLSEAEAGGLRRLLADPLLSQQLDEPSLRALSNLLAFHAPFDEAALGESLEHSQDEARLAKLLSMARSETAAQITYPSRSGAPETRGLSPIGAWLHRGKAYVVGTCHKDLIPKTFSVSRITRLEAGAGPYLPPPPGFNLQAHATRNQFRLEAEIGLRQVELKVAAEESWRLKEAFPESVIRELPDGALVAAFEITSARRFYRYALGFGRHAEILSPPELRAGYAAFLKACL
jgi:predicted DNA-binding transcriptional regulator YafY